MWWRRVNFQRSIDNFDTLVQFSQEILGRTYEFSEQKLLKKVSSIQPQLELLRKISLTHTDIEKLDDKEVFDGTLVKQDRTFFCSELVGKAFKLMDII